MCSFNCRTKEGNMSSSKRYPIIVWQTRVLVWRYYPRGYNELETEDNSDTEISLKEGEDA